MGTRTEEQVKVEPNTLGKGEKAVNLAIADDLAIIIMKPEEVIEQIETLKKCADKVRLKFSFE